MPISINGTTGISGVDGSAGTPALQGSDTNTGIAFGSDVIIGSTNGTEAFRVDSSGRLGLGASAPDERLVVAGAIRATSNAANWASSDGAVVDYYAGDMRIVAARAGSNSSTIQFHTYNSGTAAERMRIDSGGRLIVGGTSASPSSAPEPSRVVSLGDSAQAAAHFYTDQVSKVLVYFSRTAFGITGNISVSGSSTAYNTSSDYRLKENVAAVTDGIARLQQLKPSRFNFIADPDKTVDGFIAHEVQAVVPEAITGKKDAVDADGKPIYQGIDQSKLVPLLTAALQETVVKIESLETRLAALEVTP